MISTVVCIDAYRSVVGVQCRIVRTKECQVQLKDSQTARRLHMHLGITHCHKPYTFHHRLYLSLLSSARLLDPTIVGMAQSPSHVLDTMSPEFGPGTPYAIHVTIFPPIIRFANQLAKSSVCMQHNPSNTRQPTLRQPGHVSMTNPYKEGCTWRGKNDTFLHIGADINEKALQAQRQLPHTRHDVAQANPMIRSKVLLPVRQPVSTRDYFYPRTRGGGT